MEFEAFKQALNEKPLNEYSAAHRFFSKGPQKIESGKPIIDDVEIGDDALSSTYACT